jgi:hypothetical protein
LGTGSRREAGSEIRLDDVQLSGSVQTRKCSHSRNILHPKALLDEGDYHLELAFARLGDRLGGIVCAGREGERGGLRAVKVGLVVIGRGFAHRCRGSC